MKPILSTVLFTGLAGPAMAHTTGGLHSHSTEIAGVGLMVVVAALLIGVLRKGS